MFTIFRDSAGINSDLSAVCNFFTARFANLPHLPRRPPSAHRPRDSRDSVSPACIRPSGWCMGWAASSTFWGKRQVLPRRSASASLGSTLGLWVLRFLTASRARGAVLLLHVDFRGYVINSVLYRLPEVQHWCA